MINVITMPLGAYQTNCYLVWAEGAQECVVIDPGYTPEQVLQQIKLLGKSVAAVLLTHGHFDHVGGVREIAAQTGCPVYLCPEELSLPETFTAGPLYYTRTYGEGDILQLAGLDIRVMQTPGHTPGSVCLITGDVLFSGDTLFADSCGRTDLPGGNWTVIRKSLLRLSGLDRDYTVYPGHGDATTLFAEKQYNPYLR